MKSNNEINNQTKIFGILGKSLSHTLSPLIHNQLYEKLKLNSIYIVYEMETLPEKLELIKHKQLSGLSVTIPYKEWAYKVADVKDETSRVMGASNTLIFKDSKIYAYNTDGFGAVEAIKRGVKPYFSNRHKGNILILGSGGSAKGVSYALIKAGIGNRKVLIAARNEETGKDLSDLLNSIQSNCSEFIKIDSVKNISKDVELIINTTPIGMKGRKEKHFIAKTFFRKNHILFDIVYNPLDTPLVKIGLSLNLKIVQGYDMLLYQAMKQHELFHGSYPNEKMIQQIRNLLVEKLNSNIL